MANGIITTPGLYSIKFTCHEEISLIELVNGYDLVYKWFNAMKKIGHHVCAYTIHPNQVEVIIYYAGGSASLNTVVGNGKRWMAYLIVDALEDMRNRQLLFKLKKAVKKSERERGKLHQIWIKSFSAELITTESGVMEIADRFHQPFESSVNNKNSLHSSYRYFKCGVQGVYPVKDYKLCLALVAIRKKGKLIPLLKSNNFPFGTLRDITNSLKNQLPMAFKFFDR